MMPLYHTINDTELKHLSARFALDLLVRYITSTVARDAVISVALDNFIVLIDYSASAG